VNPENSREFFDSADFGPILSENRAQHQSLVAEFPSPMNREFIPA